MSRIAYLRNGSADAIATGRATTLVMFRYPISNRLYHLRNLGHVAVRPYRIDCFPRQILLRRSLLRFLLHLYPILKIDTPHRWTEGIHLFFALITLRSYDATFNRLKQELLCL